MSFVIGKTFKFAASHVLAGLPEGHQCGRLHGHNYAVWLELNATDLDATGFVYDFGELAPFKAYIDESFDHRHLNDQMDGNPTAENLARHLFDIAHRLFGRKVSAVTVWETATCWASYRSP